MIKNNIIKFRCATFYDPAFFIRTVVYHCRFCFVCLRLHICTFRFVLHWGVQMKEKKKTTAKKNSFVTFAARFIHLSKEEIWISLCVCVCVRENESFWTTLSIANLPPRFHFFRNATEIQLLALQQKWVNWIPSSLFVCLFVYHSEHYTFFSFCCRFFMQCRQSNLKKFHRKN